jgi:hypothetical protein
VGRRRHDGGRSTSAASTSSRPFYVIQAEDLDAALAWVSRVSGAIRVPIEVRPFAGFEA